MSTIERSLIEEAGDYDLEALFVRLGHAVDSIGAKRVLLDSIEALFAGLENESVLRSELRRLFRWLKDRNLTAIVTGERGEGLLTRHGLEEYISDCVILLDHRVNETVLTRRLRIVKYRGSTHGTNEYPFLIEKDGISVLPVTSIDLKHAVSNERVSTGVPALDAMFGGKGYFRGSSILVSGTAGTGKTSLTAQFVDAACARGERCAFFSFEESPNQIIRNMRSIGIDLGRWVNKGLLHFHAARPTTFGLEMHLVKLHKTIEDIKPSIVVVDPLTALLQSGTLTRNQGDAAAPDRFPERAKNHGLDDHFDQRFGSARRRPRWASLPWWMRGCCCAISRAGVSGTGASTSSRPGGLPIRIRFANSLLTDHGIELREVYLGEAGLLTGSARVTQEAKDASAALAARQEIERKEFLLKRKRKALEAQIAALQLELETETQESRQLIAQEDLKLRKFEQDRDKMAQSRSGNVRSAARRKRSAQERGGPKMTKV